MPTRAAAGPCCEHWHGSCGSLPRYDYNGLRERLQATLDAEYQTGRVSADEYRAIARTDPPRAVQDRSGRGREATPDRGPQQSEGLVETTETPPKGGVSGSDATRGTTAPPVEQASALLALVCEGAMDIP